MSHLSEDQLDHFIAEEKERPQPPLNDWQTIAARARDEGLIRETSSRGWVRSQSWMQAAAAVLLLVGGFAIGRTTTGLPSGIQNTAPVPAENVVTISPPAAGAPQALSSATASFTSADEASATLDRAVEDY